MSNKFLRAVEKEVTRAEILHPEPMHNAHEAYAVIYEEVDEFWDEVRAKKLNKENALTELIQIAAMCARAANDLHLMED